MKKYCFVSCVTVSAFTEVTANSQQEALEIAENRPVVMDFPQSGQDPNESWCVQEMDGDPVDISISEIEDGEPKESKEYSEDGER